MKAFQKLLVCFVLQLGAISLVAAKEKDVSSNIGSYFLKEQQLQQGKTFLNDGCCQTFVLAWELGVPHTSVVYSQSAILAPHAAYVLDIEKAKRYLQSKLDTPIINYELNLFLGVVTKAPVRPYMDFESRALKRSESGIRIMKKDFLSHSTFKLEKSKKGKVFYKAIS